MNMMWLKYFRSSMSIRVPCGNSYPFQPIGAARATEWESGENHPLP